MTKAARLALVAVVLVAFTTACDPTHVPAPGDKIEVDTSQLVHAKQEAGVEDCAPGRGHRVKGGMPSLTLPCLGGGPDVDVSSLRGPMLVSLWAYWCEPCRDEMPILQAFYREHGEQVPVLGVDYLDTQPGGALALMDVTGARYPSIADPYGDLSGQGPLPVIRGLPVLVFINAEGEVTHTRPGEITSERELVDLVEQHLGVRL